MEVPVNYLDKFKVIPSQTLFEPVWDALQYDRCPLCSCKLKEPRGKNILICNSKKHGRPFIKKK